MTRTFKVSNAMCAYSTPFFLFAALQFVVITCYYNELCLVKKK